VGVQCGRIMVRGVRGTKGVPWAAGGVMDWTIRFFELGVSGAVSIEAEEFGWIHLPSALRLEPFGGIPIYPNSMEFGSYTNKEQMMSLA
jgi:hypothetical protein